MKNFNPPHQVMSCVGTLIEQVLHYATSTVYLQPGESVLRECNSDNRCQHDGKSGLCELYL